jgi:hypothetical protein
MTLTQQARLINDMTPPSEKIHITYADPAMWSRKNARGVVYSAADEYKSEGIILTQADNDRISGKRKMDTALSNLSDGLPGLQIFSHCTNLIEQLSTLARDKIQPEDVDTSQEDHAYDAARYGLTNEKQTQTKPPSAGRNPLRDIKGI